MAVKQYIAVCRRCGKSGNRGSGTNGARPYLNPNVPGRCVSSTNGKHAPYWKAL